MKTISLGTSGMCISFIDSHAIRGLVLALVTVISATFVCATFVSPASAATPEEARAAARRKADAAACYRATARRVGEIRGKVVLRFEIDDEGGVAKVGIKEDSTDIEQLGRCLTRRARGWSFVAPSDGGVARRTLPFVFSGH